MRKPNYFNHEGYPDPTAYYAELSAIEAEQERQRKLHKYRPIVFICSPFAGDVKKNIRLARRYSRFAVKQGYLPIAPHLLFPQFLNDSDADERELGLFMGFVLMTKCCEVWVFGETESAGMKREIKRARWRGLLIRHFNENCQEVKK